MISTKLYLDCRNIKGDNDKKAPIKLVITRRRTSALISTGTYVKPDQWDAKKLVVINHPNEKRLNLYLSKFVIRIDNILIEMEEKGLSAGMTGQNIKEYVMSLISVDDTTDDKGLFIPYKRQAFLFTYVWILFSFLRLTSRFPRESTSLPC